MMDTTNLLKEAMAAVKAAGIPDALQATALQLAVADLRSTEEQPITNASKGKTSRKPAPTKSERKPSKRTSAVRKSTPTASNDCILSQIPDGSKFFSAIEKETGVPVSDLHDIFHVDIGRLELKVASKDLGKSKKAMSQTVTALLGGVIFSGTQSRKISFDEINAVCKDKHCFDSANAAANIKSTPGFSSVGSQRSQVLLTKSGWQNEFAKAVNRVLGKIEPAN
jgi:hypothetical protein